MRPSATGTSPSFSDPTQRLSDQRVTARPATKASVQDGIMIAIVATSDESFRQAGVFAEAATVVADHGRAAQFMVKDRHHSTLAELVEFSRRGERGQPDVPRIESLV